MTSKLEIRNSLSNVCSILNNWRYITSIKKRIGYIGWLGHGNIGDESMYIAFKKLFSKFTVLPFKYTEKLEIFEKIRRKKLYNAVFLGGGTLINYSRGSLETLKVAQMKYSPTFVLGTGVRNSIFWNRINGKQNSIEEWIECLEKCKFVGVRGPLSKEILRNNGFNKAVVTGDPAIFLAKDNIVDKKGLKKLGINIGTSNGLMWGNEENVLEFIVKFVKVMINDKWKITFLPVWKQDISYIEEAVKRIGNSVSIFYEYSSIKKMMAFLEDCDLFIGEKLHSVILAMCTYTPSIMLEYRPKCLDFMMSMGLEKYNIRTDSLDLDLLFGLLEELYKNLECIQGGIYEKVNYYKKIQDEKSDVITDFIAKGGICQK